MGNRGCANCTAPNGLAARPLRVNSVSRLTAWLLSRWCDNLSPARKLPSKPRVFPSIPFMKRLRVLFILISASVAMSVGQLAAAVDLIETRASGDQGFPLLRSGEAACIVVPPALHEVVKIAARDFAEDVFAVTGVRPEIVPDVAQAGDRARIEVVLDPALAGRWEAFQLSAAARALMVKGSDRRALAYGLYELSRRIGVSPWVWWADVPPRKHADLMLSLGEEPIDAPAVRYRGVFLNDEGWGLEPWAGLTHEPEVGNIGPRTYARLFELLLRLRANTIWPAMHPGTIPFHQVPGNAATADAYAIVLGSSHAEPMLRNNVGEWKDDKARYNYLTNREGVLAYWEQRVRERRSGESLFTLGMRGIHDSAIVGPKTQAERIATLEKIFADQRELLARYLGDGDPTRVSQMFCPYKEVLDDYLAGLRVPDDVTIVWPDDNFGYIRRFASPAERARAGGLGVYYHLSYLGAPMSWLWLDTVPPALIWSEMTRAYEQGARTLWVANVGDLKSVERSTEFFLDLAWHADRTDREEPVRFLRRMAARDFGERFAERIADIWSRHIDLATARKPEHLQWNLPLMPFRPTELTEDEMIRRLHAYATLAKDVSAVADELLPEQRDAFFQLVEYPVKAAAAANERYFSAELARVQRARGDAHAGTTFDASAEAEQRIRKLTLHYNNGIAGGKWRHVMTVNGLSPREWRRFQPDPGVLPLSAPEQALIKAPAPVPSIASPKLPPDARKGDFVERGGVVSIHAGDFTAVKDLADGSGWRAIPGLGRTGSAVTVLPSTAKIEEGVAPALSYRFYVSSGGAATIHVRLLPTFPLVSGNGLRLKLALDDQPAEAVAVMDGFESSSDEWKRRVLENATTITWAPAKPLAPGWHTLHLIAVDAGVVVDKFVIDFGGLTPSYDGPAETRAP